MADSQLGPLSDDQTRALGVVQRAVERLGRLIEDLIEFSTASREGLALHLQRVTVQEMAAQALERTHEKADKAGVHLVAELADGLPPLTADPIRLTWVLHQLLDNAIKFTPGGGQVTLRARWAPPNVLISVVDSGIGIAPTRLEEIFEPFHQLDGSPTRRYGGTGLGLSLVKLILSAHGTQLAVESEEGKGSTFSFSLSPEGAPE
jgi:signal transduction histidine kinase